MDWQHIRRTPRVHRSKWLMPALMSSWLAAACSEQISPEGRYRLSGADVADTLELIASRTYTHVYSSESGKVARDRAQWDLVPTGGEVSLVLHDYYPEFETRIDGPRRPVERTTFVIPASRDWLGRMRFVIDDDRGIAYVRAR